MRLIKFNSLGGKITLAIVLIWTIAMAYLLQFYSNFPISLTSIDSALSMILVCGGYILLENIFKFYSPKRSNIWLVAILPLILAGLLAFGNNFILKSALENVAYQAFLVAALPVRITIIYLLLTGFTIAIVIYGKVEEQLKSKEREGDVQKMSIEAELFHLRSQLQPHFLFNSLNSINALLINQPERARKMVFQLSDFLRRTIRKDGEHWVGICEELQTIKLYLDIEKVRFGHRLQVIINSAPAVDDFKIPSLLLQPIVENAVKFGLYGTLEDVEIKMSLEIINQNLEIKVSNPYDPLSDPPKGTGFGLAAVKRRLYLLYGRHDLLKTCHETNVFTVTLLIPKLK